MTDSCKALFVILFLTVNLQLNAAEITVETRTDLINAISKATPGTVIIIKPGDYQGGLHLENIHGTESQPIIIKAADPEHPPHFKNGGNAFHFSRVTYLELHHLNISGSTDNGLNIDDGGKIEKPSHHILLDHLTIKNIGPRGNRDGIKLSGIEHFEIRSTQIEHWGDAGSAIDMVGCHHGSIQNCRFNYAGELAANGVQTKGGTSDITIKKCFFDHAGSRAMNIGGSTGKDFFRPQNPGYEAKNITVEDSVFVGSQSPVAFVGVDTAVVQYNTFYLPSKWVIRILQESQGPEFTPCRKGTFSHNIIVFRAADVRTTVNIGEKTDSQSFKFSKNYWYATDNPSASNRLNLPTKEQEGTYGIDPLFINPEQQNFNLQTSSPVKSAGPRK